MILDVVFYDYNVCLILDCVGFFFRGEEVVARFERECKFIDETDLFGILFIVGDLLFNGWWIESVIVVGLNFELV